MAAAWGCWECDAAAWGCRRYRLITRRRGIPMPRPQWGCRRYGLITRRRGIPMPRPHLQPHPCSLKLAPCPHPSANFCPERGEEPDSPFPKREGGWGFRFPHANPTLPPRPSRRRRGCLPAHPPSSALFDCVLRCSMGIAYGRASTFVVVWLLPKAETGLAPVALFSLAPILSLADYKPGRLGYTDR